MTSLLLALALSAFPQPMKVVGFWTYPGDRTGISFLVYGSSTPNPIIESPMWQPIAVTTNLTATMVIPGPTWFWVTATNSLNGLVGDPSPIVPWPGRPLMVQDFAVTNAAAVLTK